MSVTISGGISINNVSFILPPSATYGWFGGGANNQVTTVNRIDYANDTATASTRGPFAIGLAGHGATGNSNYGWFGGGKGPGGSLTASVNLITYATDTATAVSTGQLYYNSYQLAAAGTSSYGWFAGGKSPSGDQGTGLPTISRIEYAVTTATATSRGSLSTGRWSLAATSDNITYGWFAGGNPGPLPAPSANTVSTIDRITYSNDTATASVRGPLSAIKYGIAGAGNAVNGWFTGGTINNTSPATVYTTVERITYATDTATASVRGPLVTQRMSHAGTGNIYFGWFAAGYAGPGTNNISSVNRVDYSNDTVTAVSRGGLGRTTQDFAASANT